MRYISAFPHNRPESFHHRNQCRELKSYAPQPFKEKEKIPKLGPVRDRCAGFSEVKLPTCPAQQSTGHQSACLPAQLAYESIPDTLIPILHNRYSLPFKDEKPQFSKSNKRSRLQHGTHPDSLSPANLYWRHLYISTTAPTSTILFKGREKQDGGECWLGCTHFKRSR